MRTFSPMLAASPEDGYDWATFPWLHGPWLGSPKIDGIRVVCHPTLGPVTRSLKPVVNDYIRNVLASPAFNWLDGEVVLDGTDPGAFNKTQSAIMSIGGRKHFEYWVFDNAESPKMRYVDRWKAEPGEADWWIAKGLLVKPVPQEKVESYERFVELEEKWLGQGFEGMMIRHAGAPYKFGRSTWREKGLIKVKRYADAEGVIVDWKPLMRNHNEAKRNERGLQERSSDAEGLVPDPKRIGALVLEIVNGPFEGRFVDVGSGFTDDERLALRDGIEGLILRGQRVTFKYLPHGAKDAPRHPIFKGLRAKE